MLEPHKDIQARRNYQKEYRRKNAEKVRVWDRAAKSAYVTKLKSEGRASLLYDKEQKKEYYARPEVRARIRKAHNKKMQSDPVYKLRRVIKGRIKRALDKNYKSGSAIALLGCGIRELKVRLESQWKAGMGWHNYGGHRLDSWEIDHRIPLSSFDLYKPEQLAAACHYSNLQPLWRTENRRKSNNHV